MTGKQKMAHRLDIAPSNQWLYSGLGPKSGPRRYATAFDDKKGILC